MGPEPLHQMCQEFAAGKGSSDTVVTSACTHFYKGAEEEGEGSRGWMEGVEKGGSKRGGGERREGETEESTRKSSLATTYITM